MSTSKNVWFVTHEQHPDPRIWKFARAFRELGAHVSYFWAPDPLPKDLNGCLPIRFREQAVSSLLLGMPLDGLPSNLIQKLREVSVHLAAGKNLRTDADGFEVLKTMIVRLRHLDTPDGLCLLFSSRDGDDYCLLPAKDELYRLDLSGTPAERAIRLGFAELARGSHDRARTAFEAARAIDHHIVPAKDDDLATVEKPNGWKAGYRYRFDEKTGTLTKMNLPPLYSRGPDSLGGTTADFGYFKTGIYDYSQMLGLVRNHVDENPDAPAPDLIYVADLPTLPIGVLLKRHFPGSRLMVDCHEWWREQELIWNPEGNERLEVIDRWERLLYAECDSCITVGEELAAAMTRELGSRFTAAYTCVFDVPPPRLGEGRRNEFWTQELGLPHGTKVALFQGSLTEKRNLETLMQASRHLREDQRLVVIGDGPFRSQMTGILEEQGNPDRVVFVGWVDQYELIEYTLAADLGVIPYIAFSPYYALSMPNKLAEYHACRLPILASKDLIEISRIVESDRVGMCIDMRDADLFGRTLSSLLGHKKVLEAWSASYTPESEKFTFRAFKSRMVELTQDLL